MEQFSSNTNRQQLTIFEDIFRIAEKSSKSGRHRPTDKNQIEENCKNTEISSTKNSPTLKISRKTAYIQKSPRAAGFPASQDSTEASQNPTKPWPEHRQSPRSPRERPQNPCIPAARILRRIPQLQHCFPTRPTSGKSLIFDRIFDRLYIICMRKGGVNLIEETIKAVKEAEEQAASLVTDAYAEADRLKDQADQDARNIAQEARDAVRQILSDSREKAKADGEKALAAAEETAKSQAEDLKKAAETKKEAAIDAVIKALLS